MVILLEILRGVAALWVFVFHVRDSIFQIDKASIIYDFFSLGYLGVPMFFVISGYVITFSAESHIYNRKSPLVFIRKRLWRVYPTLWFSIILTLLLPFIFEFLSLIKTGQFVSPFSGVYANVNKYSSFEWINVFLLTKIFWQQFASLANEFAGINTVYWSLAIEVQFYLAVACLMTFKKHFKSLLFILSILSFVSIVFSFDLNEGFFLKFWLPFSFGVLLAYFIKLDAIQIITCWKKPTYFLSLSMYILFCVLFFYWFTPQDMSQGVELGNLLFSFLFAIGLIMIYPLESKLVSLKSKGFGSLLLKPFLMLGSMSYSVYLLHTKLYVVAMSFTKKLFDYQSFEFGFFTILLTLLFCYPVFYFVERKFMSVNLKNIHQN